MSGDLDQIWAIMGDQKSPKLPLDLTVHIGMNRGGDIQYTHSLVSVFSFSSGTP